MFHFIECSILRKASLSTLLLRVLLKDTMLNTTLWLSGSQAGVLPTRLDPLILGSNMPVSWQVQLISLPASILAIPSLSKWTLSDINYWRYKKFAHITNKTQNMHM